MKEETKITIKDLSYKAFRTICKSKRILMGISQEELGNMIDGTQAMIQRIENGSENPIYYTRVRIFEALNINIDTPEDSIESIVDCLDDAMKTYGNYTNLRGFISNIASATPEDIKGVNSSLREVVSKRRKEQRKCKF